MKAFAGRTLRFACALAFSIFIAGCFESSPGYWGGGGGYNGSSGYSTDYYSNPSYAYRGWSKTPEPGYYSGAFGRYESGRDTWAASNRGRSSWGRGHETVAEPHRDSGEHGSGGEHSGGGAEHSGGGEHSGGSEHGGNRGH